MKLIPSSCKTLTVIFAALWVILLLSSCSQSVEEYQTTGPDFKLEQFFNGKVKAYGLVTNFSDDFVRRFTVDIDASWEGDTGVLDEYFLYDDGEKQFRRWVIKRLNDSTYQGKADDIIGTATGERSGAYIRWQYKMLLTVEDSEYEVSFDDQMMLIDENHMMNIAKIKKVGITVAKVTLFFEKEE
ncbi:DUF3833 domain-containing protein [Thalassotalea mangrovi]|uniref:DUF3833 domain-containing protein n=1 Tax=Thalassotalea mangrovi TaxID=2572245 RepID=A0A4U1B8W3_9GAMM|nr:DUF3833 domain-containing protein [Thalassotalea mangrovi]TKB47139.1 DUF3833 domain-containing protein [Thalassotalea mangrovi]